jgi:hypothetical protein
MAGLLSWGYVRSAARTGSHARVVLQGRLCVYVSREVSDASFAGFHLQCTPRVNTDERKLLVSVAKSKAVP